MRSVRLWRKQWAALAFPEEAAAIEFVREIRWPDGVICPHCASQRISVTDQSEAMRCRACAKRFNVRTGTLFGRSKLGLRQWLIAVRLVSAHPHYMTSSQLARDLAITQDTAWHVLKRLAAFLGKTAIRFSEEDKAALVEQLVRRRFDPAPHDEAAEIRKPCG